MFDNAATVGVQDTLKRELRICPPGGEDLFGKFSGGGAGGGELEEAMLFVLLQVDGDVEAVGGEEVGDFLGPFDDDQSVSLEQFVEADDFEILFGGDAVGVEVVDGFFSLVDVEKDVGGEETREGSSTAAPRAMPRVRWVLPAPRVPSRARQVLGGASRPRRLPRARVFLTLVETMGCMQG